MPNYEDAAATIEARLRANWLTTPVISQNVEYTTNSNTAFVYFEIINGSSFYASLGSPGSNFHRNVGLIFLHIFVPKNTGDGLALTYARQLGSIFKGKHLDGIRYSAATIGGGEVADDKGNFWRRTVSIEYRFDELG